MDDEHRHDFRPMKAVHVFVTGRVQGVGFRAFVEGEARARGLSGWVRNLSDGRVEAVLSGDAGVVDAVVAACRRGPAGAHVREVKLEPYAGPLDTRFAVRPTV
jgi:acylphosphatase